MNLRDKRQEEFADIFLKEKRGILNIAPRMGKCRIGIKVFEGIKPKSVLIAYPDGKVKQSWMDEFKKLKYSHPGIVFTTHLSLKKFTGRRFDLIVIDEIHLLSENQINIVDEIQDHSPRILGLTGTLSSWSETVLRKRLLLNVIGRYSIDQAIKEGVVTDYHITVKMVPLDNLVKNKYKSAIRTEKEQFMAYGAVIQRLEQQLKETFYLRLARMRLIQNSLAKLQATKELLKSFSTERVLVFCGLIKIAEKLGCSVFHSKSKSKDVFEKFAQGKGNHLAVVKIGNTGVTYTPLNKVIINYFDSNAENLAQKINRAMALEYNTPGKKADIWIVSSNEEVEKKWLKKALEFFDNSKITYI